VPGALREPLRKALQGALQGALREPLQGTIREAIRGTLQKPTTLDSRLKRAGMTGIFSVLSLCGQQSGFYDFADVSKIVYKVANSEFMLCL